MLNHTNHRPWPLPNHPWVFTQNWNQLLFAHWPVSVVTLREKVPASLEIDTFDGQAWVGMVPFWISGARLRCFPPIPFTSTFPELNVRTYVLHNGKPGVYMLSLDVAHRLAAKFGRLLYHLPYYHAQIICSDKKGQVFFTSQRIQKKGVSAEFQAEYRPTSPVFLSQPGTIDHWLTERYCLYTIKGKQLYRGEIHHLPWALQHAEAEIRKNTMASSHHLSLPDTKPILHYANRLKVWIWPLTKVN